jgi:hypothetical protein
VAGADLPDQLPIPPVQRPVPQFVKGQPLLQDRHQPFAAGLLRAQPDLPHHGLNPLVPPFRPRRDPPAPWGQARPQQLDRIFALILEVVAQLAEHPTFSLTISPRMAHDQLRQTIFFQFFAHVHSPYFRVSFIHESTTLFASPQFPSPGVF